jgi:glycosyltransferase involved in cell wall biosynthesis
VKVAFDHQIFSLHRYGGIARYFFEIGERMAQRTDTRIGVIAPVHVNRYLDRARGMQVLGLRVPAVPRTRRAVAGLNDLLSAALMTAWAPDIVHETYYGRRTAPRHARSVVTIHDMIPERLPHLFEERSVLARAKAEAVRRADHVICVSESTKRDLLDILGVSVERVSVVYHASPFAPHERRESRPPPGEPFILYVGQRFGYKNFERLLDAYASSTRVHMAFRLVCFGGENADADRRRAERAGLAERVLFAAGDDAALASLYETASAFVYPSLYEGFGIPLLEAMSFGCPVICSNTSSVPEVAGDAAEFFDPSDTGSIASAIERVLFAPELCAELARRGRSRARAFSWEGAADRTRAVYASLL